MGEINSIHEKLTKPGLMFSYSNVDSIKYVNVNEAIHGYHTDTSENKVSAQVHPVPKYKPDMSTKAPKPLTLLPFLITESLRLPR